MTDLTAHVEGADRLAGSLDTAAGELVQLDPAHAEAADTLSAAALPRTPRATGALAATVRASVVADGVALSAGGSGVDYAAHVNARTPWLAETVAATADTVADIYAAHVTKTIDHVTGA